MIRILIRRRGAPVVELGHELEEAEVVRLFFVLHNAVHVSRDPMPLLCPGEEGRATFVFPQEVRSLRLVRDGVDVTERTLTEG
jgi:hypothetical protein